jgi:hypothetical protein
MARFRSDQDYPLTINDLCLTVGPRGEFDWPGYDPAVHGVVAGCTRLDAPQEPAGDPSGSGGGDGDRTPPTGRQDGSGDPPAGGTGQPDSGDDAAAKARNGKPKNGSEETPAP